jgi:peptidoglycan/LPS O-acetylase OafA/YrhL
MSLHLKSIKVLNSADRTSSVDVFRGIAILGVVLFHYPNTLPLGYLGVDLFFVISGLLVGGILVKAFDERKHIQYGQFVLRRGGKIWPSYYFFIIFATLLAHVLYEKTHPEQIIPFWDMKRYLFFYQNYTGVPFHWSFDHVWSICVEEHFYILIPLVFLGVQRFFHSESKILFVFLLLAVVAGFVFKILMLKYSTGKDTYSATHNRIDALAYGVILSLIIRLKGEGIRQSRATGYLFAVGILLFSALVYVELAWQNYFYDKVVFHSLVPLSFVFMILGVYHRKASAVFYPFRVMAYYSYNWYLWHPVLVYFMFDYFGDSVPGLTAYVVLTFLIAFLVTISVEEPFLKVRNSYISRRAAATINGG